MKMPALLFTALAVASLAFATAAHAATIITNGTDAELRAAVANCGPVTFGFDGVITLTNTIAISCDVTLDGSGRSVTISGGNSNRIFRVLPGVNFRIYNLTIADGWARGTNGASSAPGGLFSYGQPGESIEGSGMYLSNATLIASNCIFANCVAIGGNGGDSFEAHGAVGAAGGGGLGLGAAICARNSSVSLQGCTFGSNVVQAGYSGTRYRWNGAIFHGPILGDAMGGAVYLSGGTFVISDAHFTANRATSRGGGLALDGGTLVVSRSTFHFNSAFAASVLAPTGSGGGGAVGMAGGASVFMDCDFLGNQYTGGNGGAYSIVTGTSSVIRCTFRENSASHQGGAICLQGNLRMTNCTLALNSARPGFYGFPSEAGRGGAIAALTGTLALDSCTVASNRINQGSSSSQGGATYISSAAAEIANSVFQANAVNSTASSNFYGGNVLDYGHNISSDTTPHWNSGSQNNIDAQLLPLANNGGFTMTMALRAGSPALNSANSTNFPPTDQRDVPRPRGANPDIGAWEGPDAPILAIRRGDNSYNILRWRGEVGATFRLDTSSNLATWMPFATNHSATDDWFELMVPDDSTNRFFRLAVP